jgi:ElaB/YqjD/DUF883 family membrane-anchored ribosome-binding protein
MATSRKTLEHGSKELGKLKAEARSRWDRLTDEDFDSIKDNVVELATRLQARYDLTAEEAKKEADEFIATVSETTADAYDRAIDALDDAAHRVDRAVRENTWATIAAAALLGGVIGYLTAIEQRRSRWY